MPLSEHEQRLLDEMERELYQNDAHFAAKVSGVRVRAPYTFVILGVLVVFLGIAVLIGGVILKQPLIGILGFGVMFVGVILAVNKPKRASLPNANDAQARRNASQHSRTRFMDRMNERWDKRQNDQQ